MAAGKRRLSVLNEMHKNTRNRKPYVQYYATNPKKIVYLLHHFNDSPESEHTLPWADRCDHKKL
jgi:hypothetical protein